MKRAHPADPDWTPSKTPRPEDTPPPGLRRGHLRLVVARNDDSSSDGIGMVEE